MSAQYCTCRCPGDIGTASAAIIVTCLIDSLKLNIFYSGCRKKCSSAIKKSIENSSRFSMVKEGHV